MKKILLVNDYRVGGGAETVCASYEKILPEMDCDIRFFNADDYRIKNNPVSYIFNLFALFKLLRLCFSFKPDVVWLHNYYHVLTPSVLLAIKIFKWRYGCKVFCTVHDFHLLSPNSSLFFIESGECVVLSLEGELFIAAKDSRGIAYTWLKRIQWFVSYKLMGLSSVFDQLFCPSTFMVDGINKRLPGVSVELLRNPMGEYSLDRVVDRDIYIPKKDKLKILFVGRLSPEKGVSEFIEDLSRVNADVIESFDIVGDGPEILALKSLVEVKDFDFPVRFVGWLENKDVCEYIARSDVMVLPSIWYENAPVSIVEAAIEGKDVLVNGIGSLPSFGSEVGNCIVYAQGEFGSLERALVKISEERVFTVSLKQFSVGEFKINCRRILDI